MIIKDLRNTSDIKFADIFTTIERDIEHREKGQSSDVVIGTKSGYQVRLTQKECDLIAQYTDNWVRYKKPVEDASPLSKGQERDERC